LIAAAAKIIPNLRMIVALLRPVNILGIQPAASAGHLL
jgi:hypothetical protein